MISVLLPLTTQSSFCPESHRASLSLTPQPLPGTLSQEKGLTIHVNAGLPVGYSWDGWEKHHCEGSPSLGSQRPRNTTGEKVRLG